MGVNRVFERPSDKKRGNTGSPRDCSAFFLFLFFSVFLLKKNETMESKIPYRKANEHYETVFLVEAQLFGISRNKSKDKNFKIVAIVFLCFVYFNQPTLQPYIDLFIENQSLFLVDIYINHQHCNSNGNVCFPPNS